MPAAMSIEISQQLSYFIGAEWPLVLCLVGRKRLPPFVYWVGINAEGLCS